MNTVEATQEQYIQVPKRCKNNGTGSDVMCSAMGMGMSTRILFTDEAAGSLRPSSNSITILPL